MMALLRVHRLALLALIIVALIVDASAHKHDDDKHDDGKHDKHEKHGDKPRHRADSHSLSAFLDDSPHLSTFRHILMSKPARDIAHHLHKHEDKVTIIGQARRRQTGKGRVGSDRAAIGTRVCHLTPHSLVQLTAVAAISASVSYPSSH